MPIEIRNPANQELVGKFEYDSPNMVEKKVAMAHAAWQAEKLRPRGQQIKDRLIAVSNLSENLIKAKATLAQNISREMGKPLAESNAEIEKCIKACEYYLQNSNEFLKEETVEFDGKRVLVQKDSLGVVLAIMPWNFPLWQVVRAWFSAHLSGNAFLLKHSDLVHGSAAEMTKIFKASLVDENLFQNLVIDHSQAESLIGDFRIKAVTLTGSTRAGKKIAALCGENLKKVVLELGGNDPYIVFKDADLKLAVDQCAKSRNLNNGQSCVSAKRFIVHESVLPDFVSQYSEKLKGFLHSDPFDKNCIRGPLASIKFKTQIESQIERLIKNNGKLVASSKDQSANSAFIPSQLFAVHIDESAVYDTELFGPIGLLVSFSSQDQALQIANRSKFGLGAAVFSQDLELVEKFSRNLECGMVAINQMVQSHPALPFGGVKDSGFGRELSHLGLSEFTSYKAVSRA